VNKGQKVIWTIYTVLLAILVIDAFSSPAPDNCITTLPADSFRAYPVSEVSDGCHLIIIGLASVAAAFLLAIPAAVLHRIWSEKKHKHKEA
jgi:hypothetical protein